MGGGFRLTWAETLDLSVEEAIDLGLTACEWRKAELAAAFGRR